MPGLHWHMPFPIETVDKVNTIVVTNYAYRTEMLTADMQYVFIDMVVQYRRSDPVKFSFEVEDPELTLQDVTESALRGVVGTSTFSIGNGKCQRSPGIVVCVYAPKRCSTPRSASSTRYRPVSAQAITSSTPSK